MQAIRRRYKQRRRLNGQYPAVDCRPPEKDTTTRIYNKIKNKTTAVLEFNIKGVLVKNGTHWYQYDLAPELNTVSKQIDI